MSEITKGTVYADGPVARKRMVDCLRYLADELEHGASVVEGGIAVCPKGETVEINANIVIGNLSKEIEEWL